MLSLLDQFPRQSAYLPLIACTFLLALVGSAIRFQPSLSEPLPFSHFALECWIYPCQTDIRSTRFWEHNSERPFSSRTDRLTLASNDEIVIASQSAAIHLWRTSGIPALTLDVSQPSRVTALSISSAGELLTAFKDGRVARWQVDGALLSIDEPDLPTYITAIARGYNEQLVIILANGDVRAFDRSLSEHGKLLLKSNTSTALALDRHGNTIVGDAAGRISIFDHIGPRSSDSITILSSPIVALTVTMDNVLVVAFANGRVFRSIPNVTTLLQRNTVDYTEASPDYPTPPLSLSVGPHGNIISAHPNNEFLLWSPAGQLLDTRTLTIPIRVTPALWTWTVLFLLITFFAGIVTLRYVRALGDHRSSNPSPEDETNSAGRKNTSAHLESDSPKTSANSVTQSFQNLANTLSALLINPNTRGPLTLSLNGSWGSGKSTLINLISRQLTDAHATCISFDAWHHQNENHLFAALMEQIRKSWRPRSISHSLVSPTVYRRRHSHFLLITLDNFAFFLILWYYRFWRAPLIFLSFVSILTLSVLCFLFVLAYSALVVFFPKLDILPLTEAAVNPAGYAIILVTLMSGLFSLSLFVWNSPWNVLKAFSGNPMSLVSVTPRWFNFSQSGHQLSFRYRFQISFQEVCNSLSLLGRRLVLVIDDLDRCKGPQILEILEAVNFLTSHSTCIVILAMDESWITHELSREVQREGQGENESFTVDRFLEKIINLSVLVPAVDVSEFRALRGKQER